MMSPAFTLNSVSKRYASSRKGKNLLFSQLFHRQVVEAKIALDAVSLTVIRGEMVGVIGPNGGGKTTLLKLIAGVAHPTGGSIEVYGKVVALLDLMSGFQPDLSGSDNILVQCLLNGLRKDEAKSRYPSIVAFAEAEGYVRNPVYTYSQGMLLRLAFSIALHSNPDILLVDESIVVGDESFKKKMASAISNLIEKKKTTVLVATHLLDYLYTTVDRVIWLENTVIDDGPTKEVIDSYVARYY